MPEEVYSIKEMLTEFRKDVSNSFNEVDKRFDKVDEAQSHTNGDVSSLKIWKGVLTGALSVITLIVIPLLVYVWSQAQDQRTKLDALSTYQQQYETILNKNN